MQTESHAGKHAADDAATRATERIYKLWDAALGDKDVEAALALYAPDVVLESPLVRHLTDSAEGVVRGRDNLRDFVRTVFARTPRTRRRYRTGFFTDGRTMMWEYPRETPDGDQMDFVEVMQIENGLIQRHRVYWGWFGVKTLQEDGYRRSEG
jgi:ketosteroid isomerase-like protein